MGAYGALKERSAHVPEDGFSEERVHMAVVRTIGGGSTKIQKNIIAKRHLGLPG